ncbi:MAG: CHAT domain-containing protein, partial [Bacteroidetes bacterium]|nr:CHAT domain-containing protein [Bacteroidota bacterium]
AFSKLYTQADSINYLEASLNCYENAKEVFDGLKSRLKTDSKFILTDGTKKEFDKAYNTYFTYYELTKDESLINKSFRFAEGNKAAVLLSSMQDMKAMEFGGIPSEQLSLEKDLKKRINGYKQLIYEQLNSFNPDSSRIVLWERRLFDLTNRYDSLIVFFGDAYPAYFELKYNANVSSINYIKDQLNENQAVLEYILLDSAVYTYLITSEVSKFVKTPIDSNFFINLKIVQNAANIDFLSHSLEDFKVYVSASNELFKVLFSNLLSEISGKKLIIIPDGKLGYLAYEALVMELPDFSGINYRNLSYLVKTHPISYSYSSTLLFKNMEAKSSGNSVLAFAPSYQSSTTNNLAQRNPTARLNPLKNAQEEVANVSEIFNSTVFTNDMASEGNFKTNSSNHDILHFAMHTILDDKDPMYSKLVFTQGLDSIEDGFLNTYEIYNLTLNAQLAVLSACNTGGGKIINGEGIMSLARGFFYSGVPSIIMTLWEVDDKSGADIMTGFYRKLKDGLSKDVALQEAKLDYLATASQLRAHPYFWAAYVNIGSTNPLK